MHLNSAAPLKTFGEPGQGWTQTCLAQQWRMQEVRNRPNLARAFVDERHRIVDKLVGSFGVRDYRLERAKIKVDCGHLLCGGVVQVACDAPSLLFLQVQQPAGKLTDRLL